MQLNRMISQAELLALAAWCRKRHISFVAGDAGGGRPAVLLAWRGGGQAMLLLREAAELRLLDAAGQQLAAASALPALFDAVDAGVADPAACPAIA